MAALPLPNQAKVALRRAAPLSCEMPTSVVHNPKNLETVTVPTFLARLTAQEPAAEAATAAETPPLIHS